MERILLGTNPVEVDSVVADMLGYAPRVIRHILYAAEGGLGICDLERISVQELNPPLQKKYFRPPVGYAQRFPCQISAEGACCTCMGNLTFALERLQEQGLLSREQHFFIGQSHRRLSAKNALAIAVGKCAAIDFCADIEIPACPPSAGVIYRRMVLALRN
jgi:hypothetical protein